MANPRVGDAAPGFTLPGVHDGEQRDYALDEFRGRQVVLVFYPGDNTPVCTRQLTSYTADINDFSAIDAQILAVSPQTVESHIGFAEKQQGFAFPLLSDSDKNVAEAYNILGPLKFYRRSVFVIGADGTVAYAHRSPVGLTFRPTAELIDAVKASSA